MKLFKDFIVKNKLFIAVFIAILVSGSFLRLYKLADAPAGYFFDEIVAGVNAYSLSSTLNDEFGNRLPDFIKIADDWRHAGIFYATAPFIKFFGFNIFAVRLATVVFGIFTIAAVYFLVNLMFKNKHIALIAMAQTAISPWLINISRSSNEIVLALFFLITANIFFYLSQKGQKIYFILLYISLLAAWFSYSAAILLTFAFALFFLLFSFFSKNELKTKKLTLLVFVLFCLFPNLFYIFAKPEKLTGRFSTLSIFATKNPQLVMNEQHSDDGTQNVPVLVSRLFHNKPINYFAEIAQNYSLYFSGPFILGAEGGPMRYRIPNFGLFYYMDIPFILIGAYFLFKKLNMSKGHLIFWLLVGAVPAALTVEDVPNIQRSIFMSPSWQIIIAFGAYNFFALGLKSNVLTKIQKLLIPLVIVGYLYFISLFMHQLIYHQPKHQNWYRDSEWQNTSKIVEKNIVNYKQVNMYGTIAHYYLFFYEQSYRDNYLNNNQLQSEYLINRDLWSDWTLGKYYFRHQSKT